MAKGNVFQGMGRGKIGDVVLSRLNGQQISRVRNRQPSNPRTNAQLYQRALMATVMQAYSAGKVIFDHSFEGKKKGSGCQAEFMRLNLKALRAALSNEIANATPYDERTVRVTGPGLKSTVPNFFIISQGSLVNNIMDNNGAFLKQPSANEKVSEWIARNGFQTDDILTLCYFNPGAPDDPTELLARYGEDTEGGLDQTAVARTMFQYIQIRPKATAFTDDQTAITGATLLTTLFDFAYNVAPDNLATLDVEHGLKAMLYESADHEYGTSGVIRSHENSGLRSNCTMTWFDDHDASDLEGGITYPYIIQAWQNGSTQVGDSDLILEGSGF